MHLFPCAFVLSLHLRVGCSAKGLLLLFIFLSLFWVTPAKNGPGFQKYIVEPINAAWIFRKCTAFPCT